MHISSGNRIVYTSSGIGVSMATIPLPHMFESGFLCASDGRWSLDSVIADIEEQDEFLRYFNFSEQHELLENYNVDIPFMRCYILKILDIMNIVTVRQLAEMDGIRMKEFLAREYDDAETNGLGCHLPACVMQIMFMVRVLRVPCCPLPDRSSAFRNTRRPEFKSAFIRKHNRRAGRVHEWSMQSEIVTLARDPHFFDEFELIPDARFDAAHTVQILTALHASNIQTLQDMVLSNITYTENSFFHNNSDIVGHMCRFIINEMKRKLQIGVTNPYSLSETPPCEVLPPYHVPRAQPRVRHPDALPWYTRFYPRWLHSPSQYEQ